MSTPSHLGGSERFSERKDVAATLAEITSAAAIDNSALYGNLFFFGAANRSMNRC